jgi:hypothetical protein
MISVLAFLSVIGRFLQCSPFPGCRKNPWTMDMQMSKAASGMIFQNHKRVSASNFSAKIAASEPLKRVLEGFLKLVSNFLEAGKKFTIQYHKQKF